ncbi:unknown [Clostridium sp. CAG:594]|nr:unknown [Clostridium sp. CAG:594]
MKKQSLLIVIVILILLGVSVGYSVVRISTNVKGKTSIVKDLDVEFESIGKLEEYGSYDATAEISDDKKTVLINVPKLSYMGAYAVVPITVKNVGQLPAKLESIYEYGTNDNEAIKITYDGIAVTDKALNPLEEEKFFIKVSWENELKQDSSEIEFYIRFNYVQE